MNDPKFIIDGIRIMVIPILTQLMDKYPSFETFFKQQRKTPEDFDFYMSTAGIGYAISLVDKEIADNILAKSGEIDKNYPPAIDNLFGFVKKQPERTGFNNILGIWILWNLKGDLPTHEEMKEVAPAIGFLLEKYARDLCGIKT